jgi:RNA polymerase sigma factor (TIGR02999 family)
MALRSGLDAISALMEDFRGGDKRAAAHLVELLYPELKRMAQNRMRQEWKGHSWQPTLLVNELYLEILKIKGLPPQQHASENDKAAFLALAGHVMKRLLIHHARPLSSKAQKVPLDIHLAIPADTAIPEIEDLLCRLGQVKPEMRTVVEMKVFHGLTADEIAAQLGCATVTVNRHWQFARHWLRKELDQ